MQLLFENEHISFSRDSIDGPSTSTSTSNAGLDVIAVGWGNLWDQVPPEPDVDSSDNESESSKSSKSSESIKSSKSSKSGDLEEGLNSCMTSESGPLKHRFQHCDPVSFR